jgi:hypothetical protein
MKLCPLCHRPIVRGPKRICSLCGKPIRQRDKWRIGPDGRLQHKDCSNPENHIVDDNKMDNKQRKLEVI